MQRATPATLSTGGYAAYQPALTTLSNDLVASVANGGLSTLQARQLYRDVTGVFDRIVSVEMIENLGGGDSVALELR